MQTYDGKAVGWSLEVKDPHKVKPGVIAVAEDGRTWTSVRGNDEDGSETWEATIEIPSIATVNPIEF